MSIVTSLLALVASAATAATQIWLNGPRIAASTPDPTAGFTITYDLGGSQWGSATAPVDFYLSTTTNGSSGSTVTGSVLFGRCGVLSARRDWQREHLTTLRSGPATPTSIIGVRVGTELTSSVDVPGRRLR